MKIERTITIDAYDKSAREYEHTIAQLPNYDTTYEYFTGLLKNTDTILDLGCGTGVISRKIKCKMPGISVTGVDLSAEMIAIAKEHIPDAKFERADIVHYRSDLVHDAIIIGFAIPYLSFEDIEQLIENCSSTLKNKGVLYVSFMDGDKSGFEKPSFNQSVQLYIYYHKQQRINELLIKNGFTILNQWQIEYKEIDGTITTDIIMVAENVQNG
jgi:predicted TPR repeat methyltransferase